MEPTATAIRTSELWSRLAELPLEVESTSTSQHELDLGRFLRLTTVLELRGGGHVGRGEDPSYQTDCQREIVTHMAGLPLTGSWTLGSFSEHLDGLELAPAGGTWDDHPNFHRWAVESAALDLALRQAGMSFAEATGRELRPLRFAVSMGLGSPPSADVVEQWLAHDAGVEFKLDSSREWTDELVAGLAATGAVRVVDIKGKYTGDWIDSTVDPDLYRRLAEGLPEAYLEDPNLRDDTRAALGQDGLVRVTWDAPIHFVADLDALEERPAAINIKPSRFGKVRELLGAIAWCEERDIPLYAGGQFELGYGRTQAQTIAAAFYADAANDIAPVAWHTAKPGDDVPMSPYELPAGTGFGFDA